MTLALFYSNYALNFLLYDTTLHKVTQKQRTRLIVYNLASVKAVWSEFCSFDVFYILSAKGKVKGLNHLTKSWSIFVLLDADKVRQTQCSQLSPLNQSKETYQRVKKRI